MNSRRRSQMRIAEFMLLHAERLIRYGFKILPLRPAERGVAKSGEAPLTSHGVNDATDDCDVFRQLATENVRLRGGGAMIDLRTVVRALGGEGSGDQLLAPGHYRSRRGRSLSVQISATARDGFVCHSSFRGDGFRACPDHVRSQIGVARFPAARRAPEAKVDDDDRDKAKKIESVRAIWDWTINPRHTPGRRGRADRSARPQDKGSARCSPGLHAQSPDRGESPSAFFGQGHPHPGRREHHSPPTGVAQALRRLHPGAVP